MKNLLNSGARFTEDNPAIYALLCNGEEISATLNGGEEACRIFKDIHDGTFYVESFPQEENGDISVECVGKDPSLADEISESNYEDFIITH